MKIKKILEFIDDVFYIASPLFVKWIFQLVLLPNYKGGWQIPFILIVVYIMGWGTFFYRFFYGLNLKSKDKKIEEK